jgi:hypothetical protein
MKSLRKIGDIYRDAESGKIKEKDFLMYIFYSLIPDWAGVKRIYPRMRDTPIEIESKDIILLINKSIKKANLKRRKK